MSGGSIRRVVLSCLDPEGLAPFYAALGFVAGLPTEVDAVRYGVPGRAHVIRLALGEQRIELIRFAEPGAPIERESRADDDDFQHLALVTNDMAAAHARLVAESGWQTISTDGPVVLPASSGSVTAFKFRDPEGHPLELLQFPDPPPAWRERRGGPLLGIDHSAIAVADTQASERFYADLGFSRAGGSLNEGPEQDRLDGLDGVRAEVTSLARDAAALPMHLELLCYRAPKGRAVAHGETDIAATRLVLAEDSEAVHQVIDPDGHRLIVRAA